ncbi:hypothetical protein L596_028689 [Steinernema carpocapsae]|uniref:Uncharacterized protein n=1 Tax=Steinernema carpocapsae TaxID=34508 RepID=A0A4U5LZ67_STECR|nr:hypothetical protein L596_028689 [Steinernema carpocapsae]
MRGKQKKNVERLHKLDKSRLLLSSKNDVLANLKATICTLFFPSHSPIMTTGLGHPAVHSNVPHLPPVTITPSSSQLIINSGFGGPLRTTAPVLSLHQPLINLPKVHISLPKS